MSIDAHLWRAYSEIRIEFITEWDCKNYVIITAWNPQSRKLSNELNCIKNLDLEQRLKIYDYQNVKVGNPSFSWVEDSFAVEMTLTQGCELAQKYQQNAIYWVENGVLFLVSCDESQTQKKLGLLGDFLR
ncbi:DUF3293 domain-containing protein [Vibrio sp. McD22-P3]|uniref:DUF3293 domain-containing protein n=1 Tax=Vibrio sp. McD22-P3 TaxID=2724880 RepID=UPI001F3338CD|nr:DUF3293 domain-containing protein [Vibrio sp. McD22-P3]MCF4173986.1 DUF3293 domain-containing protein [Vibrio sp. McD22-P3]